MKKKKDRLKVKAIRTTTNIAGQDTDALVFHCKKLKVKSPGIAVIAGGIKMFDSEKPDSTDPMSIDDYAVLSQGATTKKCAKFLHGQGLDISSLKMLG